MLQQICEHIHNYFERNTYDGEYSIVDGVISPLPSIKEGQRFRIDGSDLNDGVYTFHSVGGIANDDNTAVAKLSDEDFSGSIITMAVPPEVIELASDIGEWVGKFSTAIDSPFQSEQFNGYSYTLKSGGSGSNVDGSPTISWQNYFAARLNKRRKTCLL